MERGFLSKRYWLESDITIMRVISGLLTEGKDLSTFIKNATTRPLKDSGERKYFQYFDSLESF